MAKCWGYLKYPRLVDTKTTLNEMIKQDMYPMSQRWARELPLIFLSIELQRSLEAHPTLFYKKTMGSGQGKVGKVTQYIMAKTTRLPTICL